MKNWLSLPHQSTPESPSLHCAIQPVPPAPDAETSHASAQVGWDTPWFFVVLARWMFLFPFRFPTHVVFRSHFSSAVSNEIEGECRGWDECFVWPGIRVSAGLVIWRCSDIVVNCLFEMLCRFCRKRVKTTISARPALLKLVWLGKLDLETSWQGHLKVAAVTTLDYIGIDDNIVNLMRTQPFRRCLYYSEL